MVTLRNVRQEADARGCYISAQKVLEEISLTLSLGEHVPYLQALVGLPGEEAFENEVAGAISSALTQWPSPGVKAWSRAELPGFIARHFSRLASWLTFDAKAAIRSFMSILATHNENTPKIVIEGIAQHVDALSAEHVYALISLTAQYVREQDAAAVLERYLSRCLGRIPKSDLDPLPLNDIPSTMDAALARFLFAFFSDCDVRIRWRTAHAVRRLARFGQMSIIHSLLNIYDRTTESSFRAPQAPFYWIAARLWTMIAVDRIAAESPSSLAPYGNLLLSIACDEVFPHVLIRGFAKEAVEKLVDKGVLSLEAGQLKVLKQANSARRTKRRAPEQFGSAEAFSLFEDRRFHFDTMDTLPYWYEPATRIFADVGLDEFVRVAEQWIVDRWGGSTTLRRWQDEPRLHRLPEHRWGLWSNDHGSRPTLERYRTYLEWHGMWCATGTLLQSRPVAATDPQMYSTFDTWVRGERLSRPPFWLADLRAPKPLERQFWSAPESDTYITAVEDKDFLSELGLYGNGNGKVVVDAQYRTRSSHFRAEVNVRSALVQPETAGALMRALQTIEEPYHYWLPYDVADCSGRIDESRYRLLGWLSISNCISGLDESDPARNEISGSHCEPGRQAMNGLTERVTSMGMIEWIKSANVAAYSYQQWSDNEDDEDWLLDNSVKSHGSRLWVVADALHSHLVDAGLDLLVKIELTRKKEDRYARVRQEETPEARFDRILIFRRDGTIEAAEGNLGTWCIPCS